MIISTPQGARRSGTMKRYAIHAYDANHNELWITIGTSFVGAEPCRRTDRIGDVVNAYELIKTGKIIDPETNLPVIRHRDPNTGHRTNGSRYVAYFRIYENNAISTIFITYNGRKSGVRNYQTRRDADTQTANIIGCPPMHTSPRIVKTGRAYVLAVGEGDPYNALGRGKTVDRWGDPAICIATCTRVKAKDVDDSWWGYTCKNHRTGEHYVIEHATIADVYDHLDAIAARAVVDHGPDITRW